MEGNYEPAPGEAVARAQNRCDESSPDVDYWLMDHDGIYPLRVGVNTIGRLPDNNVVIQGAYVSRRHCAILVHARDGCELHDIASKNGTYINGLRLCGPTQLSAGDEIRMCDRQFIFMSKHGPGGQPNRGRTEIGE
jgi:pSer/pThr/pTyr-binding forkhead associated (FHA) protein